MMKNWLKILMLLLMACGPMQAGEIHDAVKSGDLEKLKQLLAAKPELVNAKIGTEEYTPLHVAAMEGKREIAEFLLANKANVKARDYAHDTPLHTAVQGGKKDIVELLIANKADLDAKNVEGNSPLTMALLADREDIALLLLAKGTSVTQDVAAFVLIHAVENARKELVEQMLARKADVNARIKFGQGAESFEFTPLHMAAAANQNTEIAELLLARKAGVNAKDDVGRTPMHYAARSGNIDMIKLLLAHNAEINAKDRMGRTALDLAERKKLAEVVTLLRSHGGKSGKELGDAGAAKTK